jgi:hypothetical protein
VPPDLDPEYPLGPVTVGAVGDAWKTWFADCALVPPGVVTVIQYDATLSGSTGEKSVIDVELFTVTALPEAVMVDPPAWGTKFTEAPTKNPEPVIVMAVPPDVTPVTGVTPLPFAEQFPFESSWQTTGTAGA